MRINWIIFLKVTHSYIFIGLFFCCPFNFTTFQSSSRISTGISTFTKIIFIFVDDNWTSNDTKFWFSSKFYLFIKNKNICSTLNCPNITKISNMSFFRLRTTMIFLKIWIFWGSSYYIRDNLLIYSIWIKMATTSFTSIT